MQHGTAQEGNVMVRQLPCTPHASPCCKLRMLRMQAQVCATAHWHQSAPFMQLGQANAPLGSQREGAAADKPLQRVVAHHPAMGRVVAAREKYNALGWQVHAASCTDADKETAVPAHSCIDH